MPQNQPRKSLTQRVADRKAGVKDTPSRSPKQRAVKNRFEMFGTGLAMFGLFMLAYTVYKSAGAGSWANENLIMYTVFFVAGRAFKAAADALSRLF
ncbi:MAG: hypothetical protein E2O92_03665 [Alphaproteobacteria bacterium]|nr:MAG: hypothetical protein E2O92_03665 [Alphaproteobacteria bacterium]